MLTRVDDPRFLTILVAAFFSAALWLLTWSAMGGADMAAMDMGDAPMDGMATGQINDGAQGMAMDGMAGGAADGAAMGGDSASPIQMGGEAMDGMAMQGMDMFGMSMDPTDWSAATIAEVSAMWLLMMAAMMLPAMAPVMAVYAGVSAKEDNGARLALRIGLFTISYFLLWAAFSVAAALVQMGLRGSEYFMMGGTLATPLMAGVLAIIAGAYQFTRIKHVCLTHCRHPLQYLLQHWKPGLAGAFPVGLRHGLYCFGCCVVFMVMMFVFGAMNLWWMAAIALFFLAEKILPQAEIWGRVLGAILIIGGLAAVIISL